MPPRFRGQTPGSSVLCLLSSVLCLCAALGAGWGWCGAASAQEQQALRLDRLVPGGARSTATEAWGAYDIELTNQTDRDRLARVLLSYDGQPDVQYGRDVWVPARSALKTWALVGPAPARGPQISRDIQYFLYDRTDGQDVRQRPRGDERVSSRGVPYRRREPFTAVLLDDYAPEAPQFGRLPQPDSAAEEVVRLARVFRHASDLSDCVFVLHPGPLPPAAEAFDGVDHFVVASNRLGADPAGLAALRRWLERGGRVWVLLDKVGPEVVAPLLGDAFDFEVVDRTSLTDFRIEPTQARPRGPAAEQQAHERAVDFVRVLLPPGERAPYAVNGWPAWFSRRVGAGKVVFSTLGPRAWSQPRANSLPVEGEALHALAAELRLPLREDRLPVEAIRAPLAEEIGYSVAGRGAVALAFGGFLAGAVALGFVLGRSRRPELRGWVGPAAALAAAGLFVALGAWSRRGAAPTVAAGQIVHAVPGTPEAAVQGLLAVYRPDSGPADAGATQGGLFELDMAGAEGQTRRLVLTDLGRWHWENLALPAGVRFAPFRLTAPTGRPVSAVARFGPDGLEGQLEAGPFREPADALLTAAGARNLAVRLGPDGTFRAGGGDALPAGQPLPGGLLSDRQQRRQAFYREFFSKPRRLSGAPTLLAWATPAETHFTFGPDVRAVGDALLIVPLRLERPAAGQRVTIPAPLVPCRRLLDDGPAGLTREGTIPIDMLLRFQLPAEVLPFRVERARLSARVTAPSRRVTVAGRADGQAVEVFGTESPLAPIEVELTDERFLRLDKEGGLLLNVAVSAPVAGGAAGKQPPPPAEKWLIEYLELEVAGRAEDDKVTR
jgi:hypothetical protein